MKRVEKIFDSFDARRISRSRLPKLIFDFIEGATGREIAAMENINSFDEVKLLPRSLIDVSERSLSTSFLGENFCYPFGIAPMGMCNLAYPNADILMAKIAKEWNLPQISSLCKFLFLSPALNESLTQGLTTVPQ